MGYMMKGTDITNIVRKLQQSMDPHIEARLMTSEQRLRELENELQEARDRLTEHESRRAQRETVSEGYGEGVDHPGLEERLERLSELLAISIELIVTARSLLADAAGEEANPPHLLRLIEELCHEGDRLAEEARKDKEDLQLQFIGMSYAYVTGDVTLLALGVNVALEHALEAADKQLRSTRGFLDEQAAERETERDEFGREVQRLQEALGARDRDRLESERLTKEFVSLLLSTFVCITSTLKLVRAPHVTLADTDRGINTNMIQQNPEPHIESLETQVKETTQHLQVSDTKIEELNAELKAAQDKVSVLRDVIHNLEVQLDNKTKSENELQKLLASLQGALDESKDELSSKRLHSSNLSTCSSPSEDVSARGGDLESPRVPPVQQSPERPPSPLSLRRLQERLAANGRAEEAACKRVRDLEMQLQTGRTAEEEMHMERQMLQQRVEEQLLQISALQAALDQQRLAQSAIDARDAAATRRKLQNAAEQLDQAKDQLQAKENEILELKTQLENTRKSITMQEESMTRQAQQIQKELDELHSQLDEARQEKEALEVVVSEQLRRRNSHLLDSLLAEKNSEIDELGLQVSTLREKLEHVSLRMAGDTPTRDDIQELLQEVRSAHSDLRSHYSAVQSTLHSSHMGDTDGMRKAHVNGSLDFPRPVDDSEPLMFDGPMTPKGFDEHISMPQQIKRDLEHSPLLPPAPPAPSSKDFGDLESELLSTRMALAQKDAEIEGAKADLQEYSSKQQAEIARLKEDNNQLREELIALSGRLEEYVQLMQSEMERSAELEQMQEGTSSKTESLQHLIARVHKSGFDVLSASEKCLLYHRTRALLQGASQSVATQTSRSGLAETKQLLELQQQLVDTHQDAKLSTTKLLDKVESLETALGQERIWASEARRAQDEAESSLAAERHVLEEARRARAEAEAGLAAERQSAEEARQAHAAQSEELKALSEKSEEVQAQIGTGEGRNACSYFGEQSCRRAPGWTETACKTGSGECTLSSEPSSQFFTD
ncbi:hypothetical protein B566_EDAN017222 [Ephemera danica]|nr:hypothetical protein B566_EDAN017222 [Ephemera danica]